MDGIGTSITGRFRIPGPRLRPVSSVPDFEAAVGAIVRFGTGGSRGGVDQVAEMTGRTGRIVRNPRKGNFQFVKRVRRKDSKFGLDMPLSEEDTDRLNLVEKKKFMDGRKPVAIISDAASTGISLHAAAKSAACHRRRVHFTIELPWAAGT